jgi:hypothetical protein
MIADVPIEKFALGKGRLKIGKDGLGNFQIAVLPPANECYVQHTFPAMIVECAYDAGGHEPPTDAASAGSLAKPFNPFTVSSQ